MKRIQDILTNHSLSLIIVFFLFSRLLFLTRLPLFTDESIYIYWAKVIATTHSQWFLSLTDGKPPLLIWMIGIFLSILPENLYLIAGRLPSVISGLASLVGLWYLSGLLFRSKKAQVTVTILYIIHPFTLIYDRMALFDSLLQATVLWSVYFSLLCATTKKFRHALFWGVSLGLAFLSKPTALIFLFLTPMGMLLYSYMTQKKVNLKRSSILIILALVVAEVINNLQRVSHVYFMADLKNSQFQQPISVLLRDPFQLTVGNLNGLYSWMIGYYSIPFFIIVLVGFATLMYKKWNVGVLLFSFWFLPVLALATIGREIFPRYILFTTPYALLAATYVITTIFESAKISRSIRIGFVIPFVLPLLLVSTTILFTPEKAAIPPTDHRQYVSEHPSGYGLTEVFQFIAHESQKEKVILVTQGTFGLYPYAFTLEYWGDPRVEIIPRWPLSVIDNDILLLSKSHPVYIILKEHDQIPSHLPLDLVLRAEKPGGAYPILVTKLRK